MGKRGKSTGDKGMRARHNSIEIDFRDKGIRYRETIKLPPTKANMRFAANMRAEIKRQIARGTFDLAEYFPNSKKIALFGGATGGKTTVGKALWTWVRGHKKNVTPAALREYEKVIKKHLEPAFGHMLLTELTRVQIKDWRAELSVSASTINNILVPLNKTLQDAHIDGLITKNPMEHIKTLKRVTREPDPFTPSEMKAILAQMDGQILNLYQLLFFTGLRTSEVIALEWGDIGSDHIRVRRAMVRRAIKEPKSESGIRKVKLLQPASEALERQKAHTYLAGKEVFHDPLTNAPWVSDKAQREAHWKHALKRAKVPYRVPYQCRHTYASMLLSSGENAMWVAKQMGHADTQILFKRYARWIPDIDPLAGTRVAEIWKEAK